MKILRTVLLCGLAAMGVLPKSEAAPDPQTDPEEQLAARRRQSYADNQRRILAAFQALPKAVAGGAPVLTAQLGHSRAIGSLSLSRDGRLLVTGSDDRTARLWEVASGRELRRFVGQQSNVTATAISPDGKLVATGGGDDPAVRVWDAATGAQRLALLGHGAAIGALTFLPDGKSLASVDWDDSLRIWDLATGQQTSKIDKAAHGLSATFAPDGKSLLTVDSADHVTLLEVATGALIKRLELKESRPEFAFSADAALAAIGGSECDAKGDNCRAKVWLWETAKSALQALSPDGEYGIRALAIAPDKRRLAVGTGAGLFGKCEGRCMVQVLELPGGRELWRQARFAQDIKALAFTPDGKSLIAAGNDAAARIFDAATGRIAFTLGGEVEPVSAVRFSPDGRWLAVGTGNGVDPSRPPQALHVILWDLATGREARRLELFGAAVSSLFFSADSRLLAAGVRGDPEDCPKCTARLWEAASGREVQSFATDVRRGGFALSPDGRTVAGSAAGAESYTIALWDARSGKSLQRVESGEQWAFAFAPASPVLATVGGAGNVTLRSARTGQEQRELTHADADMRPCVAISPDGNLVAAGATSLFSSAVWELKSGKVLSRLDGHSRDVTDISLSSARSARGSMVATASLDATALLWAARSGKLQQVLVGHLSGVTAVAFSPDDRLVLTGSLDGTARLWDVASGRPLLQLSSFGSGDWLVLSADGRFDSPTPSGSSFHWVDGDKTAPAAQAAGLTQAAHEPALLRRVLGAKSLKR